MSGTDLYWRFSKGKETERQREKWEILESIVGQRASQVVSISKPLVFTRIVGNGLFSPSFLTFHFDEGWVVYIERYWPYVRRHAYSWRGTTEQLMLMNILAQSPPAPHPRFNSVYKLRALAGIWNLEEMWGISPLSLRTSRITYNPQPLLKSIYQAYFLMAILLVRNPIGDLIKLT